MHFKEKKSWRRYYDVIKSRDVMESHIAPRAGLRYCGALSTWQSRCPFGVGSEEEHRSPSPVWGFLGSVPRKFFKNER